jgi:NarL family two-component system response regulator LiaR
MATVEPIRVLIVDDHAMVRTGLKQFLASFEDLQFAGEASNGAEAVTLYQSLQPDVVLMDLLLPNKSGGIDAIRQIVTINPMAAVIALTSFHEVELVKGALSAGATSYLLKNITANELAEAIRSAYQGRASLAQEATEALIRATRDANMVSDNLTEREHAVLELLVSGASNAEIAESLVVSVATVKFHVGSILSKLGAANRAEAVSLALRRHLVNPES